MKIRRGEMATVGLGLVALAVVILVLPFFPNDAQAVTCPTTSTADADLDGIPDAQECGGITFQGLSVSTCTGSPLPGLARNSCLDPNSKDIFVVLVKPASGSILDQVTDPFLFLYQPRTSLPNSTIDGLGLGVHVVTVNTALALSARTLVTGFPQRAIQMTESLNADSPISGQMNLYGTPSFCTGAGCVQPGDGTVYTARIRRQVNGVYFPGCNLSPPTECGDNPTVWSQFIQRTIAHEIAHALALELKYDKRYGGNHNVDTSNVIMQQNVTYDGSGASAVFHIGVDYASGDNDCERKIQVDNKGTATCIPF